jgi:hypothetical protein
MQNPAAVEDALGEWFEIEAFSPCPFDIDGWTIKDSGVDDHVIDNDGPLILYPGEVLVLGNNADMTTNGGAPVDYEYSGFVLGNGYDEIILLDNSMTEAARLEYDNGLTFPDPEGASMQHFWLGHYSQGWTWEVFWDMPFGDGDSGSPGEGNPGPIVDELPLFRDGFEGDPI